MTEQAHYSWDLTEWNPPARRTVSLWILGATALLLIGALLYFGFNWTGLGLYLWIALGLLIALFLTEVLVVATGLGTERAEQQAATTSTTSGASITEEPAHEDPHVDLKCPECADLFSVHDTGERPLPATCPHCGAVGHVDLPKDPETTSLHDDEDDTASPWSQGTQLAEAAPEQDAPGEVKLRCPACQTEFTVDDAGQRPLGADCPGCGRHGHLR